MFFTRCASAAALVIFASTASAATLTNGDFENGLNGWTVSNFNGDTEIQDVAAFDTNGDLTASNAARFNVGRTSPNRLGGIVLSQDFNVDTAGLHTFALDIAVLGNPTYTNADAGMFELLVDGISLASRSFGGITKGQTLRDLLSARAVLAQGTSTISIAISRSYFNSNNTPMQFIDNVTLGSPVSEVPLPAGMPLMLAGMGAFAFMRRKKKAA